MNSYLRAIVMRRWLGHVHFSGLSLIHDHSLEWWIIGFYVFCRLRSPMGTPNTRRRWAHKGAPVTTRALGPGRIPCNMPGAKGAWNRAGSIFLYSAGCSVGWCAVFTAWSIYVASKYGSGLYDRFSLHYLLLGPVCPVPTVYAYVG